MRVFLDRSQFPHALADSRKEMLFSLVAALHDRAGPQDASPGKEYRR
jgi:hypothetical protein